jgi:hypothetical protein
MTKTIACIQSSYIPWKGYFDIINSVDEFVLYDDVQYSKNTWRNRNRIKTPNGLLWLTIPVITSGKFDQRIMDVRICKDIWRKKHWKSLKTYYAQTEYFHKYSDFFRNLYLSSEERSLSTVNYTFLTEIRSLLGITTPITWSMDYSLQETRLTERVVELCAKSGATTYLSGPKASEYFTEELFAQAGIKLRYVDYSGYKEYPQLNPPFEHAVSIIDLIFNTGPQAVSYLKSFDGTITQPSRT